MKINDFSIALLAALILSAAATGLCQHSADEYIRRGKDLLEKKQYLEALASFESAVKLEPNRAEAYYFRGTVQLDRDKADADFTRAIVLKPDYSEAYFQRGLANDLSSRSYAALRDYTRAIELNPRFAEAYKCRAVIYLLDNKGALAIADYTKAIELKPDGESYYVRGNSYLEIGESAKAITDLTRAIELDPTYYWTYKQRAKAYRNLKKYQLAEADERKAVAVGPPKVN
jgi:tetratricopeptide (TPR) repeat protein